MKTDNLTASEAERALLNGYKVQPISWSGIDHILSVEGLHYGDESPYRIYTTDEDVAKWREKAYNPALEIAKPFKNLSEGDKIFWRGEYFDYLTTLPELTEGATNPTAPQAYKFPYEKIHLFENKIIGVDKDFNVEYLIDEINDIDTVNFIYEAINEKLNRK